MSLKVQDGRWKRGLCPYPACTAPLVGKGVMSPGGALAAKGGDKAGRRCLSRVRRQVPGGVDLVPRCVTQIWGSNRDKYERGKNSNDTS
jgi:hypothetical protein